jgi:hypothetical protein
MNAVIWQRVRERAEHRCEFCGLSQDQELFYTFHLEHIIARQHGGGDDLWPSRVITAICTKARI